MSTILVTGTSSGFGRLIAEAAARGGHRVYAGMREVGGRNAPAAAQVRDLAAAEHLDLHVVPLDTSDPTSIDAAVTAVVEGAGGIDVLVNNVGQGAWGIAEAYTAQQVEHLFEVNVLSAVRVTRAVLPHMRARRSGLLVFVSAAVGRFVLPFMTNYAATKHALEALGEGYRYELAPFGIDSVLVEPAAYLTPGSRGAILRPDDTTRLADYADLDAQAQAMYDASAAAQDAGQAGDATEVAHAVLGLIDTPAGQRPLRTPVGGPPAPMITPINELTDQIQTQALGYMGLGHLTHLAQTGRQPTP